MDPALLSTVPVLFAAAVAFCVAVYVLADGFDLGVGIVLLATPRGEDRDRMIASIGPAWDGNEIWLVMGGTLLFAAFPVGYYGLLSTLYLPILLMLIALAVRGVAFAVRPEVRRFRRLLDVTFAAGSIVVVLCQGFVLGALIDGLPIEGGLFGSGPLGFVSLQGLLCVVGLLAGYALLGAGWLIWKTEGATQVFGREIARVAMILTGAMILLVAAWGAYASPQLSSRWFNWPQSAELSPLPIATAVTIVLAWRRIWTGGDHHTFMSAMAIFLLGFVGLGVSLWPYVLPYQLTIWEASSGPRTLMSFDKGIAVIIPIVLFFQAHAYWVFRGKAPHEGAPITVRSSAPAPIRSPRRPGARNGLPPNTM